MDQELKNRLDAIDTKLQATYESAEKTRKYFLTTLIVTLIAFLLPLVGLLFAIPSIVSTYSTMLTL